MNRRKALVVLGASISTGCLRLESDSGPPSNSETTTPISTSITESSTSKNSDETNFSLEGEWHIDQYLGNMIYHAGYVYGSSWGGELSGAFYKINREDGSIEWELPITRPQKMAAHLVSISGSTVYGVSRGKDYPNNEGHRPFLFAIDDESGNIDWYGPAGEFKDASSHNVLTSGGDHVAYHQWEGEVDRTYIIKMFDANTGNEIWKKSGDDASWLSGIDDTHLKQGELAVFANELRILDAESGSTLQSKNKYSTTPATISGNKICVSIEDEVHMLEWSTLKTLWRYSPKYGIPSARPVIANVQKSSDKSELVFVGSDYGIHCLHSDDGSERWSVETKGKIPHYRGGIAVASGVVYAWDALGFFYAIEAATGKVLLEKLGKENKRLASDLLSDGSVLYCSLGEGASGDVIPTGTTAYKSTLDG